MISRKKRRVEVFSHYLLHKTCKGYCAKFGFVRYSVYCEIGPCWAKYPLFLCSLKVTVGLLFHITVAFFATLGSLTKSVQVYNPKDCHVGLQPSTAFGTHFKGLEGQSNDDESL